jgi:hypothetical protein
VISQSSTNPFTYTTASYARSSTFDGDGTYRSVIVGSGPVSSGAVEEVGTYRVRGSRLIIDSIRGNYTPTRGSGGQRGYRDKPLPAQEYEFRIQGSRLLLRKPGSTDTEILTRKR